MTAHIQTLLMPSFCFWSHLQYVLCHGCTSYAWWQLWEGFKIYNSLIASLPCQRTSLTSANLPALNLKVPVLSIYMLLQIYKLAWGLFQNSALYRMKQMNEDLWEECNCLVFIRWSLSFPEVNALNICCTSVCVAWACLSSTITSKLDNMSVVSMSGVAAAITLPNEEQLICGQYLLKSCLPATEHFIGICGFTVMLACVCAQAVGRDLSEPPPHTHTTRVALDGSSLRAKPSSSFSQSLLCAFCFWTSLMKVQWTQVFLDVHMMGLKPHLPSLLPACSPPPASQLTVTAQCPYKGWGSDHR